MTWISVPSSSMCLSRTFTSNSSRDSTTVPDSSSPRTKRIWRLPSISQYLMAGRVGSGLGGVLVVGLNCRSVSRMYSQVPSVSSTWVSASMIGIFALLFLESDLSVHVDVSRNLRGGRLSVWIFLAKLLPLSGGLFRVSKNLLGHHAERWTQGSCVTITVFVDRQLVRVLAPKEISRPSRSLVCRVQIETDLLRKFPISRITSIPQAKHRPGPHPRLDRPATHGSKLHIRVTLVLVTENTDLAFGDFHLLHKSNRLTMAVLHRHNIGTSH